MAGNSAVAGQSVASKLSAILLTFNEGGTHTFTEIAQLTGLTLSTTHRLATELAAHQVLERTTDGRLRPGASLRTLAQHRCAAAPYVTRRRPCSTTSPAPWAVRFTSER